MSWESIAKQTKERLDFERRQDARIVSDRQLIERRGWKEWSSLRMAIEYGVAEVNRRLGEDLVHVGGENGCIGFTHAASGRLLFRLDFEHDRFRDSECLEEYQLRAATANDLAWHEKNSGRPISTEDLAERLVARAFALAK